VPIFSASLDVWITDLDLYVLGHIATKHHATCSQIHRKQAYLFKLVKLITHVTSYA